MAAEKTTQAMTDAPSRSPLVLILALAACAGVVAFSIYLGLQKSGLQDEQQRLDSEIASLKTEIESLQGQKVEAAQLAQKWLKEIEKSEIRWSGVITRINSLIPFDATTNQYKVQFLSYSGSGTGKISLNGQTRATDEDPYPDVADLIQIFNGSSFFSKAYVPSVTRGETDQGKKMASFIFSTYYQEETPLVYQEETPSVSSQPSLESSDETVDASRTKVSRQ